MDRETRDSDLVELGIASADTHGSPIPNPEEEVGFLVTALTDD